MTETLSSIDRGSTGDRQNGPHLRAEIPRPIGRSRERVFLHEELARAIAGQGRLVLLSGEAGIGKTTLANETQQLAHGQNAIVLTAHCYDLTSPPPYGLWLDLAQRYPEREEFPRFPPALASGDLSDIQSQSALFSDVLVFLKAFTLIRPVVIIFEDLHWSDSASLELLRFVASHIGNLPILLLITYRLDELTRQHPLYKQLPGLVRSGNGIRLDLKRLDTSDTRALIRSRHSFASDDELRLADYLEQHAEGNPFFALELMRALEEDELITTAEGKSSFAKPGRVIVPQLLAQVLEARVDRIGESARAVLAIASVIGTEFSLSLWQAIAGIPDEELFQIVERAVAASVLVADPGGTRVRFSHALARDALYESILPARRRGLHCAVAAALIAEPRNDPDAVAHHLLLGGDDRAPEWLVRAGERAQRAYTWLIAADRFVSAARELESQEGTERERGWLLYRAARLVRLADPERGLRLAEESRQLASVAGDSMMAGDARYSAGLLRIYSEEIEKGYQEVVAGIEMLESLPHEQLTSDSAVAIALADSLPKVAGTADIDFESSLALQRSSGISHRRGSLPWWLAVLGRNSEAVTQGNAFAEATQTLGRLGGVVQSALAHDYHGMGYAHGSLGDPAAARVAFETARSLYQNLDHFGVIALTYLGELRYVGLPFSADDKPYLSRLCGEIERAIDQAGGAIPPGFSSKILLLSVMVTDGRWDEALEVIRELPSSGNTFFRREVTETTAHIAARRSDHATAWGEISRFLPDGPLQSPGSKLFQQALFFQRLAAELCLESHDYSTAFAWLEANDRWLAWSDSQLGLAEGKLAWARYWLAIRETGEAADAAADAVSHGESPRQPLVLVSAHRLLGDLELGRNHVHEAEEHLDRSLSIAEQCHASFEIAQTLVSIAKLQNKRGDELGASGQLDRAATIAIPLKAPALNALIQATHEELQLPAKPATPFGLTPREIEILQVIAEGLSDAAAAERLFISPRTVGQHLRSIYGKLGVSSRSAATRVAIEHGLS